jgi:hypothetical protein
MNRDVTIFENSSEPDFDNHGVKVVFVTGAKVDRTVQPARESIRRLIQEQLAKEERLRRIQEEMLRQSK